MSLTYTASNVLVTNYMEKVLGDMREMMRSGVELRYIDRRVNDLNNILDFQLKHDGPMTDFQFMLLKRGYELRAAYRNGKVP